jgi:hypothetical protein
MAKREIRLISDHIGHHGLRARIKSLLKSFPWLSIGVFSCELLGSGYLEKTGWRNSAGKHLPVDRSGAPLPWLTYPAISFLQKRLEGKAAGLSVFEYGSGNSTLWWSKQVQRVVSCEHDPQWSAYFRSQLPPNVEYIHRDRNAGYAQTIKEVDGPFDVVVIDGVERNACAEHLTEALSTALSQGGIVVWDNSDWQKHQPGMDRIRNLGFREVEFSGLGPIGRAGWSTTVFYRSNNFIGL